MAACPHVGNQLPILLISFGNNPTRAGTRWESVTNPLDKLLPVAGHGGRALGISYQSS